MLNIDWNVEAKQVIRVMRAELILALMLVLVSPGWAAHEAVMLGPYNVSFDMNTTMQYQIFTEQPTSGVTSSGLKFVRYNMSVETADYFAWVILTGYEKNMLASINSNKDIVEAALMASGCESPKLYQPLIDGQPGVLGNCRFEGEKGLRFWSWRATHLMPQFGITGNTAVRPTAALCPLPLGDNQGYALHHACRGSGSVALALLLSSSLLRIRCERKRSCILFAQDRWACMCLTFSGLWPFSPAGTNILTKFIATPDGPNCR